MAAVSLAITVGLVTFDFFQAQSNFPYETFIGQVNVSGLNQAEAVRKLSRLPVSEIFSPVVTIEADRRIFTFSPEALGLAVSYDRTVKRVFAETHRRHYLKELKERLEKGPFRGRLVFSVDQTRLVEAIGELAAGINTSSKDASIVLYEESGGYKIEPEELGREVMVKESIEELLALLAAGGKTFPLIVNYSAPRVTEEELRAFPPVHRLAAYTTYYGKHDSPNRIHNIKLIASWLEGTLLLSGETFSLNDKLGELTPERGFKEAYTIIGGELSPQLGGGACQIATTLYNAASLADLGVTERKNHSFYFNIYPLGRDAAVYPGQVDFKFANNSGHPVLIKAVATNRRLSFRIYGTPNGREVRFSPPRVELLDNGKYRPASIKAVLASDLPFKTTLTRAVYDSAGKLLDEEVVRSYYKLYGEKSNVPIARPEPR